MDFLSGLLLAAVVLVTLGLFIRELVGDRLATGSKSRQESPAKAVNEYLVGETGTVVEHADDENAPLKVRIGIERWNARTANDSDSAPEVGTEIEVTAVDGLVLTVVPQTAEPSP